MMDVGRVGVEVIGCSNRVIVVLVNPVNDAGGGTGGALASVQ